jgi:hypothetical protein
VSKTLQQGLIQAGLVAPSEERPKSHIERKLENYPLNRFGRHVVWAKWLVRRSIPVNHSNRCCICGQTVRKNKLKRSRKMSDDILGQFLEANLEAPELLFCKKCLDNA